MKPLSIRAMASVLGISKSQVARDAGEGMPMTSADAARAWRAAARDLARSAESRIDREPTLGDVIGAADPAAADDAATEQTGTDQNSAEYRKHRADNERIRSERAQLELDQLKGSLIAVDDAKRLAFTAFRQIRDLVLNVPARVSAQLAAETDAFRISELLDKELTEAFAAFTPESVVKDTEEEDDDASD
jgi:hypothetical protein